MELNPWFIGCDIESNPWFVAVADTPTKTMNSNSLAMSAPAADAGGEHEEQQGEEDGDGDGGGSPKQAVNPGEEEKTESGPVTAATTPIVACGFQER